MCKSKTTERGVNREDMQEDTLFVGEVTPCEDKRSVIIKFNEKYKKL